jgi:hypothetical protein
MGRTVNTRDLDAIPEMEWVRLAAFIDGEGHVGIQRVGECATVKHPNRYFYVNVIIANTDPRLPEWLLRTFGGTIGSQTRQTKRWKTAYKWRVSCRYGCEILRRARPYLLLKKEQCDVALALDRTMDRVGVKGHSTETRATKERLSQRMHELNARGPRQTESTVN